MTEAGSVCVTRVYGVHPLAVCTSLRRNCQVPVTALYGKTNRRIPAPAQVMQSSVQTSALNQPGRQVQSTCQCVRCSRTSTPCTVLLNEWETSLCSDTHCCHTWREKRGSQAAYNSLNDKSSERLSS